MNLNLESGEEPPFLFACKFIMPEPRPLRRGRMNDRVKFVPPSELNRCDFAGLRLQRTDKLASAATARYAP
jgi:hypothetical protein